MRRFHMSQPIGQSPMATDSWFCSCHIFKVVSTAVLSILLILSDVSTFVFSIWAKIRINALINCFLSVSSWIISSNSSWIQLDNPFKKSKNSSVEPVSLLFPSSYSSSSLSISSKMSEVLKIVLLFICSRTKRFVLDAIKNLILSYFYQFLPIYSTM